MPLDPARRRALVAAVYLGSFIATLDISVVNLALPTLQRELSIGIAGLQWVVDIYALTLSAFMLSAGPLGDRYGRKRTWLVGVLAFTAGSVLCAVAGELPTLLVGRCIQGLAGALLIPAALSLLSSAFPDLRARAKVIGGWSSFTALALIAGPILGGFLVEHAGWPSIFLINVPLGMLAWGFGVWGIQESSHPDHAALDPGGQILSVVWLGALTFGLISAGEHGWTNTLTWAPLGLSAIGLTAFLWVEMQVPRPLLPLTLFKDTQFSVNSFASFVLGFTSYASLFFLSIFLQQVQGASAADAGWRMAPQFVATALTSALFGRLNARFGTGRLMIAGYGLIGAGMLSMGSLSPASAYGNVAWMLVALGLGAGLAVPATSSALMASVSRERAGMASATMNVLRQTGMTLGIAVLGALMSARSRAILEASVSEASRSGTARNAIALAGGFNAAMLCAGAVAFLAAALLLLVKDGSEKEAGL